MMSTDVGYSFQCMMDEVTRNRAVENPTNTTEVKVERERTGERETMEGWPNSELWSYYISATSINVTCNKSFKEFTVPE